MKALFSVCSSVCGRQGADRECVQKPLWKCVTVRDIMYLSLNMWFDPEGVKETDVRDGKLSAPLVCHHIL